MKSSNLGRVACLRFLMGRAFCAGFSLRKKLTETTDLGRAERVSKQRQRNPPYRKLWCTPPAVLRLCPSKGGCLIRDALRKAPALKTPSPQSRPLQASTSKFRRLFVTPEKFTFLGARLALPVRLRKPRFDLCSARNRLSYLRTRNSLKWRRYFENSTATPVYKNFT